MNTRFVEETDQWREVSRWVKFQENVEDGGKRWSKPFVPSTPFSVFSDLRQQLQTASVILKSDGKDIQEIVGKAESFPSTYFLLLSLLLLFTFFIIIISNGKCMGMVAVKSTQTSKESKQNMQNMKL